MMTERDSSQVTDRSVVGGKIKIEEGQFEKRLNPFPNAFWASVAEVVVHVACHFRAGIFFVWTSNYLHFIDHFNGFSMQASKQSV